MADGAATELIFSLEGLDPEVAGRVVETMSSVREVDGVAPAPGSRPAQGTHKGGWTDIAVKLAPAAFDRLGAALAALFGLPGAPVPVIEVGTANGPIRVPYDPRHQNLSEVVTEVQRLMTTGGPKPS